MKKATVIINKKAKFEYILNNSFVSGIVLTGAEIKSIRQNNELFIINMSIEKYKYSNDEFYNPKRPRKLLLNKVELGKINKYIVQKGSSIIPYKLFINEKGLAKLEIYTAVGKKLFDKRSVIKDRDNKRSLERIKKNN